MATPSTSRASMMARGAGELVDYEIRHKHREQQTYVEGNMLDPIMPNVPEVGSNRVLDTFCPSACFFLVNLFALFLVTLRPLPKYNCTSFPISVLNSYLYSSLTTIKLRPWSCFMCSVYTFIATMGFHMQGGTETRPFMNYNSWKYRCLCYTPYVCFYLLEWIQNIIASKQLVAECRQASLMSEFVLLVMQSIFFVGFLSKMWREIQIARAAEVINDA